MFSKKKETVLPMDTIIGEYTTFTGNIDSEGSVKILGKVEGDIKSSGEVYIEPTASIKGNVYGSNVYVSGTIAGNVFSKGILHLMAQSKLLGDIEVNSIVTDEGAIFHGNCKMIEVAEEEVAPSTYKRNRIKSKRNNIDSIDED
ncbi:MAG: bactofilin family protein [Acetivibrionales bacterium]|jgi:cytoskeletal protein CcmA (bactofilin family)|nr:polymer-forming cytoskeletal protein [Clostridiaceae bacterium]